MNLPTEFLPQMPAWLAQLGPLLWPLALSSLLALALTIERLLVFLFSAGSAGSLRKLEAELTHPTEVSTPHPRCRVRRALQCCFDPSTPGRTQREAMAQYWFDQYRQQLTAHLSWLSLIAVISPLLGLLGTVLGMIDAFSSLSAQTGPVSPALLAGGLQQAMTTTAAGLLIAVPTLIAAHGFRIWAQARLDRVQACLNRSLLQGGGARAALLAPENAPVHDAPAHHQRLEPSL